jgi:hypothetical protein
MENHQEGDSMMTLNPVLVSRWQRCALHILVGVVTSHQVRREASETEGCAQGLCNGVWTMKHTLLALTSLLLAPPAALLACPGQSLAADATEFFVAPPPLGSDANAGTSASPFATPYGPIAMVPALVDLTKVPGVREWWHTDGLYLWREGGKKMNGIEAATALRESLEEAAAQLPFRYTGDDVFFHTTKMADGRYRIYAIEPGWAESHDRTITVKIQLPGESAVKDLLNGETIEVGNRAFPLSIPAGTLRIVETARR